MKNLIIILILALSTTMYSQIVTLLDESFDNGLSESWDHCSGNWGKFEQWNTENGYLKEGSGSYFVRVLNGVLIPKVDMEGIEKPILEIEYALGEIDSITQLSIYYTSTDSCSTIWDTLGGGYLLEDWNLIANFPKTNDISNNDWIPNETDFETIQIELDSFLLDTTIRIGIVSDYNNTFASGKWYINSLKLFGDSSTNVIDQISKGNMLKLFPNPSSLTLNMLLNKAHKGSRIMILNTSGQLIYSTQILGRSYQIDVSNYSKGMYILQCILSDEILTNKFVVE